MRITDESKLDVDFEADEIWCTVQAYDKAGKQMLCLAHLDSGRLFTCDYKDAGDASRCTNFGRPK